MTVRSRLTAAFVAPVLALGLFAASAERGVANTRLALVVGIGNYQSVSPLDNPVQDATLMASTLKKHGFVVTLLTDPDQGEFIRGISDFGRTLRDADKDATGLFYYAGHGVQSFGTNYLLPSDASLVDAADLDLVAIQADSVLRQMASARNRTNIVILDACRNNPFETIPAMDDNGLAEMKAPTGTFLALSTAPGSVAVDGVGMNSPFTAALAEAMQKPGQIIEEVFKEVRVEVLEQTQGLQVPWDTSSLLEDFIFSIEPTLTPEQISQEQLWTAVESSRDPIQIMLFLRANPGSHLEQTARALLRDVMAEEMESPGTKTPVVAMAEPVPQPAAPNETEATAFESARAAGTADAYDQFLAQYPSSVYAEIASVELNALTASRAAAATTPEATSAPKTDTDVAALVSRDANGPVTFDQPLSSGSPDIVGRSIMQLVEGTPLFPPIDGLPEELWKGQTCKGCHSWTRDALCTQAGTYLANNNARALDKQHPYGGGFKVAIRNWAGAGCP